MANRFADAVLAAAPVSARPALSAPRLAAWWKRACEAWPAVRGDAAALGARVGRNVTAKSAGTMHLEDLALVHAALAKDAAALRAVDAQLRGATRDEELAADLRETMLLGASPRLDGYAGRSPLAAWLKVTARRAAIDRARVEHTPPPAGPVTLQRVLEQTPELLAIAAEARGHLQAALGDALASLDAEDRELLAASTRGQTLEQLAAKRAVPRSTLGKKLQAAREQLILAAKASLKRRTGLDSAQLRSLINVLGSNLELSLSELK